MRVWALAVLLVGSCAHAEHGVVGNAFSDGGGKAAPAYDGMPLLLPGTAESRLAAGLPPVPAAKPAAKKSSGRLAGPAPVVFLGVGVDDTEGQSDAGTFERAKAFRRALSLGDSGARVVEIYPLTLAAMTDAWASVRRRERFVETPSSALFVLDTTFAEPANALGIEPTLGTAMGPVRWSHFVEALRRLDRTVFPGSRDQHPPMETAVLGSFVGQVDCDELPGPMFGASANRGEMEPKTLETWFGLVKDRREFPLTARHWYENWSAATALAVPKGSRGFYCTNDGRGTTYGVKAVVRPWLQPSRSLASGRR